MTRRTFYGPQPTPPAQFPAPTPSEPPPAPIQGARAIKEALGLQKERQVYALVEAYRGKPDGPPIHNVPGLGLTADRHALLAWWARLLRAPAA